MARIDFGQWTNGLLYRYAGWRFKSARVRMLRKHYLAFLLPVLLLLAQQGAVLHEFSHLYGNPAPAGFQSAFERASNGGEQKRLPASACEKCLVYAHLAGAVSPHIPVISQPLLTFDFAQQLAAAQRGIDIPTARSRGPPVIL
jgi:hypothetical protein